MEDKERRVQKMFSSIAGRYDLANRVLTLNLDSVWRKKLVRLSSLSPESFVLDCATGTGRLAFDFLRKLGEKGRVIGVDFCEEMLNQIQVNDPRIQFQKANVLQLPFSENTFDRTSIAYGLRNLSNMERGLAEMARVTKPKGFVMVLETGSKFYFPFSLFLKFYFKYVVPVVGGWITGQPAAYQYLQKSTSQFPAGRQLIQVFEKTKKFKNIQCFRLWGGASYIYKAQVQ